MDFTGLGKLRPGDLLPRWLVHSVGRRDLGRRGSPQATRWGPARGISSAAVKLERTDDVERWAAACRSSGQPVTPFHSFPWLTLAAEMTQSTFVPLVVRSGGSDIGVAPWLNRAQGPVSRLNWLPFPYAGPLVPAEHLPATVRAISRRAVARRAIVQELQLAPHAAFEVADLEHSRFSLRYDSTYLIDTTRSEEELWAALASSFRNKIRQAERKQVQVTTPDDAQQALGRVVEAVFAHNGITPHYPRSFPPSKARLTRDGLSTRWVVAQQGEVVVGSQVALLYEGRAVGWMGGVMPEFRNTHATVLMYWDAIRWARESGAVTLDLVGTPNGGIDRFKSQFGGSRVDYPVLTRMAPGLRELQERKQRRTAALGTPPTPVVDQRETTAR